MARLVPQLSYEWVLSPSARPTWRSHRRAVEQAATGRVLDLGGPDRQPRRYPAAASVDFVGDPTKVSGTYDTVVSVLRIGMSGDPTRLIAVIARSLAEGGRLLFLEHARSTGPSGRLQRAISPFARLAAGHHVDRDVPALLRAGGLRVTDIERFSLLTNPWPNRDFVRGVARLKIPAPRGATT